MTEGGWGRGNELFRVKFRVVLNIVSKKNEKGKKREEMFDVGRRVRLSVAHLNRLQKCQRSRHDHGQQYVARGDTQKGNESHTAALALLVGARRGSGRREKGATCSDGSQTHFVPSHVQKQKHLELNVRVQSTTFTPNVLSQHGAELSSSSC